MEPSGPPPAYSGPESPNVSLGNGQRFCGKCGAISLDPTNIFCTNCGQTLTSNPPPMVGVVPPVGTPAVAYPPISSIPGYPNYGSNQVPQSIAVVPGTGSMYSSPVTSPSIISPSGYQSTSPVSAPDSIGLPPASPVLSDPNERCQRIRAWIWLTLFAILLIIGIPLLAATPNKVTPWYAPILCPVRAPNGTIIQGRWIPYSVSLTSCPAVLGQTAGVNELFSMNTRFDGSLQIYPEIARTSSTSGNLEIDVSDRTGFSVGSGFYLSLSSSTEEVLEAGTTIRVIRKGNTFGLFPSSCSKGCDFKLPVPLEILSQGATDYWDSGGMDSDDYPLVVRIDGDTQVTDRSASIETPPLVFVRFKPGGGLNGGQIAGVVLISVGGLGFLLTLLLGAKWIFFCC